MLNFDVGRSEYLNAGQGGSLANIFDGGGAIACRIKLASTPSGTLYSIVGKGTPNDGLEGWRFGIEASGDQLELSQSFGTNKGEWVADTSLTTGVWIHVAVVYDNSDSGNDPVFYLNGVADSVTEQAAPSGLAGDDSGEDMLIGSGEAGGGAARFYDGGLRDVRVYNRLLTAEEVAVLAVGYSMPLGGEVGWWRLDVLRKEGQFPLYAPDELGLHLAPDDVIVDLSLSENDAFIGDNTWEGTAGESTAEFDSITTTGDGAFTADPSAAKVGTNGFLVDVGTSDTAYGVFNLSADTFCLLEFWIDPDGITMADGDQFFCASINNSGGNNPFTCRMRFGSGNYRLHPQYGTDGSSGENFSQQVISDDWHHVRMVAKVSSGPGNDDGYVQFYIDGLLVEEVTGIDSDSLEVDELRVGANFGVDAGTVGTFSVDVVQYITGNSPQWRSSDAPWLKQLAA